MDNQFIGRRAGGDQDENPDEFDRRQGDLASRVASLAGEAIQRLYDQETNPEFAARAAGWTTPEARRARLKTLRASRAWPVTATQVVVSPIGDRPAGGDYTAADRVAGSLGDVADWAAREAGLEDYQVRRSGAYAWAIHWSRS